MDEVGQEVKSLRVAIHYTDISELISDAWQLTALLRCGFTSALTSMSPTLLFIHSALIPKLLTRLSFMRAGVKIFNCHLNHKSEFTIITGKTLRDYF